MDTEEIKVPSKIFRDLDINEVEEIKKEFETTPIVEAHQIKLPIPRKLVTVFELDKQINKGTKIKVYYDDKKRELVYKLRR